MAAPIYRLTAADREHLRTLESRLRRPKARRQPGQVQAPSNFKPYVTVAAPRRMDGFEHDPQSGRTIIKSRHDEREVARRTQCEWD